MSSRVQPASLRALLDDRRDRAKVLARGELRDDAAVGRVQLNLARNNGGSRRAAIADDGGGRFVAGGFDREDVHGI